MSGYIINFVVRLPEGGNVQTLSMLMLTLLLILANTDHHNGTRLTEFFTGTSGLCMDTDVLL